MSTAKQPDQAAAPDNADGDDKGGAYVFAVCASFGGVEVLLTPAFAAEVERTQRAAKEVRP